MPSASASSPGGLTLIRAEQPARAAELQSEVLALQRRLALTRAEASDLGLRYRPAGVARFVLRNLVAVVVGLPLALVGLVAFGPPTLLAPRGAALAAHRGRTWRRR